jgi:hypothetical protein
MPALSVGKLYSSRAHWPEVAQYNYRGGAHELVVFYERPTSAEVYAFRSGTCEFGLFTRGNVIWLLSKFGDLPWQDHPFSWHLVPERERDLPSADLEKQVRAMLQVVLVDAATGIVRVLRAVTWSPDFTRAMHAAIREQASKVWDPRAHDVTIASTCTALTTTEMVERVSARTVGGA